MIQKVCKIYFLLIILMLAAVPAFSQVLGDVNSDGNVDIVDALVIARFYVGLDPGVFDENAADVNADGSINIVDALLVARFYVGLISEFPRPGLPPEVMEFRKQLEVGFGSRFMVEIEPSPLEIYPPRYIVNITCITDDLRHGDLSAVVFNISDEETVITILTSSLRASYLAVDPQPEGELLYEGMRLWLEQTGSPAETRVDPLVALSLINVSLVDRTGCIYFSDRYGREWLLYRENGRVILEPAGPGPAYPVPENLEAVKSIEPMDEAAESLLLENGFVVLGSSAYDRLSDVYFRLFASYADVSTFITTDALLHVFHMVYDNLLKTAEKDSLAVKFGELVGLMNGCVEYEYNSLPDNTFLKEAARRLWLVFSVGQALAEGRTAIPAAGTEAIAEEANAYLQKVYAHTVTEFYPGDDYTLYEPRGHYAGDRQLENYFRAMKWISRRIFRVDHPSSQEQADYELAGAGIMSWVLTHIRNNMHPLWLEIYDFTSLLVDTADSITPDMVDAAMRNLFGDDYTYQRYRLLEERANLLRLRQELLSDAYPESEIIPVPLANPGDLPRKYVQFMGERYIIDGEAMQRTCFPDVPGRVLPLGLDVAATVLDSRAAYAELADEMALYPGLQPQIDLLCNEFSLLPAAKWQRSTYNWWLYTLRALGGPAPGASPRSLQSPLWQREKLNTQLASWTELRHDNILYAKQTMVPSPYNPGLGIVEPYPEFYTRLEGMCSQLIQALDEADLELTTHRNALSRLSSWARTFGSYAEKIVAGLPLQEEEQTTIKQWGLGLLSFFASPDLPEDDPELVADVASSSITGQVLHEGVGKLNPVIIIYEEPESNKPLAAIGYVLSYYEFAEDNWNRLNDDEWKKRLETAPPVRPVWTQEYLAP